MFQNHSRHLGYIRIQDRQGYLHYGPVTFKNNKVKKIKIKITRWLLMLNFWFNKILLFHVFMQWTVNVIVCVSVPQSCLTSCDPMDCSLPGSSVHRNFQARILEWVAIFLLQGSFPIQGWNPCLLCFLHCKQISLHAEPSGKAGRCGKRHQLEPGQMARKSILSSNWRLGIYFNTVPIT